MPENNKSNSTSKRNYSDGYLDHEPPVFEPHHDDVPSHYEIPNEPGYFPASKEDLLVAALPATLYQMHPEFSKTELNNPIASGLLILNDPDDGTANEVAFVGECDGILLYVQNTDATTRISSTEFMWMLPQDCILVDVADADPEAILHFEAVLAARTQFHDETQSQEDNGAIVYPEVLPDDVVSRGIYRMSKQMSRMIIGASDKAAQGIQAYGEKKRDSITETQEKKVGKTSIKVAKATRRVSDTTLRVSTTISDKISSVIGGGVGRAVAIKEGDTAPKRKARQLLLASTIAMDEVAGGFNEGYELMVKAAKNQATSFVAKKYGEDAAELARHTAGSAANFGRTALTARRIVNVKKIAKSAGKSAIKTAVKNSLMK